MTPITTASAEMMVSIVLKATAAGLIGMGVMGLTKAYHNPLFAYLSHFPLTGVSSQEYDLPTDAEREQLAQYSELDGLDIRVDRSSSEVPGGQVDGFKFGPIGSPGMVLSASAFEDPKHLSGIISHELGHLERGDTVMSGIYIMAIAGFAVFSVYIFKGIFLEPIDGIGKELMKALMLLSLGLVIYTIRRFNEKSRDAEYDADRRAVQRLGSAESLMEVLRIYGENREESKKDSPGLISRIIGRERHPHPDDRIEQIKKEHSSLQNQ